MYVIKAYLRNKPNQRLNVYSPEKWSLLCNYLLQSIINNASPQSLLEIKSLNP